MAVIDRLDAHPGDLAHDPTAAGAPAATTVTVIPGDGVGPEIMAATRRVVDATGVPIDWEECEAGASVFVTGLASGVPRETIDSLARTKVALKGPLETPVGYGEKSANVTLRKLFETFGNLRPVRTWPGVPGPYADRAIDLLVVRENVEDLYAGIEHQQTPQVAQCLKLMSSVGCERIARLAFEAARADGRSRVQCATKANIMKLTEGLLKRAFEEVAADYPDIQADHIIIDNCAHQLVRFPERFDVIVTSNMNGDIISDLTSGLVGGLGFAPSANIGAEVSIFEAVHGSAPKYAGRDTINPSAVILAAAMMLRHLGHTDAADRIEASIAVTLAAGIRTRDVAGDEGSVGTQAFADALIKAMAAPDLLDRPAAVRTRPPSRPIQVPAATGQVPSPPTRRRVVGVDVFVESHQSPDSLGAQLAVLALGLPVRLKMISNRGTQVWPSTGALPDCVDHWRCRFVLRDEEAHLTDDVITDLMARVGGSLRWMHIEKLAELDGAPGYTRAQGES